MLKREILSSLKEILNRFKNIELEWSLVGSTSSALQSLPIEPKDIDISSNREDAFKIEKILHEYCIRKVKYNETPIYSSYFGLFRIGVTKVEVMGDLKIKRDNIIFDYSPRHSFIKYIPFEDYLVPVTSLENQLVANILINFNERVDVIAKYLRKYTFDREYFRKLKKQKNMREIIRIVEEKLNTKF